MKSFRTFMFTLYNKSSGVGLVYLLGLSAIQVAFWLLLVDGNQPNIRHGTAGSAFVRIFSAVGNEVLVQIE